MPALTPSAMRILISADSVGGVWRYALDAARALNARGALAAIAGMGPAPSPSQRREAERSGVELMWLDTALDWMAPGTGPVAEAAEALDRVAAEWQPTVLHLNAPPVAAHLAFPCARIVAAHSCLSTWWRAMRRGPAPAEWDWHWDATRQGFAAADAVIAPSVAFAEALTAVYGSLPHLRVVWNGSAGIAPAEKRPYVLGAGRWWDESKNLSALDEAAALSRWPVRVVGPTSGPNGTVGSAAHVELLGDLPHERARKLLAEAAIFVSPSVYEPFGLAVLEAASAGAALVLSDIPTFRELWHDCALFARPHDAGAFADAINLLAANDAERRRLGDAARVRSARYGLDAQVAALLSVYSAAARARSMPARGAA